MRRSRPTYIVLLLATACHDCGKERPAIASPALVCEVTPPQGWTVSPSPMPDHLLELIDSHAVRTHAGNISSIHVQESKAESVESAVRLAKEREHAMWGTRPGFALIREQTTSATTAAFLVYARQESDASDALVHHHIAVLSFEGRIVEIHGSDRHSLQDVVTSLKCMTKRNERAHKAFKGIELYGWEADDEWVFVLLPGTNANKTAVQVKAAEPIVRGVENLERAFAALAKDEEVFWTVLDAQFAYPPSPMREAIAAAAKRANVKLVLTAD